MHVDHDREDLIQQKLKRNYCYDNNTKANTYYSDKFNDIPDLKFNKTNFKEKTKETVIEKVYDWQNKKWITRQKIQEKENDDSSYSLRDCQHQSDSNIEQQKIEQKQVDNYR